MITLINPMTHEPSYTLIKNFNIVKQFKLPPLGLLSIASQIEEEIQIIDADLPKVTNKKIIKLINENNSKIIGLTSNSGNHQYAKKLINEIKKQTKNQIKIMMGGPQATIDPKEILDSCPVDYIIRREGELAFKYVIKALKSNKKISKIIEKPIPNIHDLKPRNWDLVDVKQYRPSPASFKKLPAVSTILSRGCPYNCNYCNKTIFGKTYRTYSLEQINSELIQFSEKGIKDINFFDDVFTLNKEWTYEVSSLIGMYNFIWNCSTRVNLVDEKILTYMYDSGCYEIGYGIESGTQEMLNYMRKGVNLKQIKDAIKLTKDVGIDVKAYFMIGFPNETKEQIEKTIEFSMDLDIDIAAYNVVVPYKGTEIFDEVKDKLKETGNSHITFAPESYNASLLHSSEYLNSKCREAYRKFYMRKRVMLNHIKKSMQQPRRYITAAMSVI